MLWLVVIDFPDGGERKIGLWLGLVAVLMIAAGGFMATMDDAPEHQIRALLAHSRESAADGGDGAETRPTGRRRSPRLRLRA